jgi:hypothetical protein
VLGTAQNPGWLDLSDFVVHFTKAGHGQGPYFTAMSILSSRTLIRGPGTFGAARKIASITESQRAVCFSEVPIGYLSRIAERRESRFGVGFTKRFILDHGGAPLWYLEQGTAAANAFNSMVYAASQFPIQIDNPIWKLTPFVDYPSGPESPFKYDFRWEREWRIAGDLHFKQTDVAFLLIPEDSHAAARSFFADAEAQNLGPSYVCPFIDPTWTVDQVKAALSVPGGPSSGK